MLRRKPDNSFEYRHVELTLLSARPAPLTAARREAMRLQIMANLGPQEAAPRRAVVRERWVTIPAGVGLAAAIIAASQLATPQSTPETGTLSAQAVGEVLIDGQPGEVAAPGQSIVARSAAWIGIADDVRVGMEPGARITFAQSSGGVVVAHQGGAVTVISGAHGVRVEGAGWSAAVAAFSVMKATPSQEALILAMEDGTASVTTAGRSYTLSSGAGPLVLPFPVGAGTAVVEPVPPVQVPPASSLPAEPAAIPEAPRTEGNQGAGEGSGPAIAEPKLKGDGGNSDAAPGQASAGNGEAPNQAAAPGNSGVAPGHADPPGNSGNAPGTAQPPAETGTNNGQGVPADTPANPPITPPAQGGAGVSDNPPTPPAAPGASGTTPGNAPPEAGAPAGEGPATTPADGGSPPEAVDDKPGAGGKGKLEDVAQAGGPKSAEPGASEGAPGQTGSENSNAVWAPGIAVAAAAGNNGSGHGPASNAEAPRPGGRDGDEKPAKLPSAPPKKGRPA